MNTLVDRLKSGLIHEGECLVWKRCKNSNGYGKIGDGNQTYYTHRIAYEIWKGPIPDGMEVMHSCDNRLCCEPKHLFLGTHQENMKDMFVKERHAFGENNGMSKLSEDDVLEIKLWIGIGKTNKELAKKFSVTPNLIGAIRREKVWSFV